MQRFGFERTFEIRKKNEIKFGSENARRSSSSSALFNVNWITGMKVQTTNDKKPVKTILMPFNAMYCSTVAAYIFHLSLSIIRCVRFSLDLTVFVSRSGLSVVVHPLFFLVCVFAVSCFYLCSIYQSSLHALCVSTTHISLPTRLLWISLSRMNSNERRSYGFAFFFWCIFFILFVIFIIIIVVTIIVILHRLSASPMGYFDRSFW